MKSHMFQRAKELAKRIKPWAAVALALGLALVSYYAVRGVQFLNYGADQEVLAADVSRLSHIVGRTTTDVELLQADLETSQQKLEATCAAYSCQHPDHLVALVADTARDAGVSLDGVKVAGTVMETVGDVQYELQPLDLWVGGSLTEVFSFLDLLNQRAPTAKITELNLGGLQEEPAAQIQVVFYLSPQYVTGEEAKQ